MMLQISISKNLFVLSLLVISISALAQEDNLNGRVMDEKGEPLTNVRVFIYEAPMIEVYTDQDGNFSLPVEAGQTLVANYADQYLKSMVISEPEKPLEFKFEPESGLIPLGYDSKVRKEEMAVSASHLKLKKLNHISANNPANGLFGQIRGLRLYQNAAELPNNRNPGMDIRGVHTMQDNSLLVLVDGVERPLNTVVWEQIESITVLKDAAAKARYGLQGANGVLLVTTRRGNAGQTNYKISFDQGITEPTHLPEFLNAPDYARAVNEAMLNDGIEPRYSATDIERFESGEYPYLWPDVNWIDETLRDYGQFSRFNFDVTGGNQSIRFYTNFNYQTEKGLFKHTDAFDDFSTQLRYDKLSLRSNLDIELAPRTTANINVAGYLRESQQPAGGDIMQSAYAIPSAMFPVRNFDGSWGGTNQYANNPVAGISATGYDLDHMRTILVDLRLNQDLDNLLKGLKGELFVGYDNQANFYEDVTKTFTYTEVIPVVDEMGNITDTVMNILGEDSDLNPSRSPGDIQTTHFDIRGKLKYQYQDMRHNLKTWLLYQFESLQQIGNNNTFRYSGLTANLRYGFLNRYFLDATLAYEGSNRIQEAENRFDIYPAIGLAWLLSNEDFMVNLESINLLKIRASYGKTGYGMIPIRSLTNSIYGAGPGYVYGDEFSASDGLLEAQVSIPQKMYESSREMNIGLDTRLFGSLSLTAEYFENTRENIFVSASGSYSSVIGIFPEITPDGIVENKGYEVELTWDDQVKDFSYFISGWFSQYQNTIIEMNEVYRPYDYMKREGESINQHFGWEIDGFYNQEDLDAIDNGELPTPLFGEVKPGDIKYVDQNDDGLIDQNDQVPIGYSSTPEIYYAFNLGLGYKNFNFSALFQGAARYTVYMAQPHVFRPLEGNNNISTWYENYWSEDNMENAELPRLSTEANPNNFRKNDIWLQDNPFLKLRYAQISYTFPSDFSERLKLQKTRIYIQGRNLLSFDNIEYTDPENLWNQYPSLRSYTAGISVTF